MSRAPQRRRWYLVAVVVTSAALVACSGGDDAPDDGASVEIVANEARCLDAPVADEPVLGLLDGAIVALEAEYGAEPELFEVSIDQQRVSMVVAVDGTAEQSFWCGDAGYAPPEALGEADGATFLPSALDVGSDTVLAGVRDELDDPEIIELVAVGNPDGSPRLGLSVQSASGGVLFVEVTPDGDILSVQAL